MNKLGLPAWAVAPNAVPEPKRYAPPGKVWLVSRDPVWAAMLRRYLRPDLPLQIWKNPQQLPAELRPGSPGFVVYDWQAESHDTFLQWRQRLAGASPPVGIAVVGRELTETQEMMLRGAGVWHVVRNLLEVENLAIIVHRYFRSLAWWCWPDEELSPIKLPWESLSRPAS